MAQSLAVQYRPSNWDSIIGQDVTVKILQQQVIQHCFKHAYIFQGYSGDGKTTTARIFANSINNNVGAPIELDAASNNSVDHIRDITKSAYERSVDSEYKIYIIDEAHALSNQAWQAFLKCIEEPPEYTIFIFCTTDHQKIPLTIKNRCQIFNFNKISSSQIYDRLKFICDSENFVNYDSGISYISKICNGGMRDAISLLEKCASFSREISIENAQKVLGNYSYDKFFDLVNNLIDGNEAGTLNVLDSLANNGTDFRLFVDQFTGFIIDTLKYYLLKDIDCTKIPASYLDELEYIIKIENTSDYYNYVLNKLNQLRVMLKNDTDINSTCIISFIQICRYM